MPGSRSHPRQWVSCLWGCRLRGLPSAYLVLNPSFLTGKQTNYQLTYQWLFKIPFHQEKRNKQNITIQTTSPSFPQKLLKMYLRPNKQNILFLNLQHIIPLQILKFSQSAFPSIFVPDPSELTFIQFLQQLLSDMFHPVQIFQVSPLHQHYYRRRLAQYLSHPQQSLHLVALYINQSEVQPRLLRENRVNCIDLNFLKRGVRIRCPLKKMRMPRILRINLQSHTVFSVPRCHPQTNKHMLQLIEIHTLNQHPVTNTERFKCVYFAPSLHQFAHQQSLLSQLRPQIQDSLPWFDQL